VLAELDLKALFESQEALTLFLAFFIPGFIAKKIYGLFVPIGEQDFSKQFPEVIGFSAIHYALFSWVLVLPFWHVFWAYMLVFGIPLIEAPVVLRLRKPKDYTGILWPLNWPNLMRNPKPTPWDIQFTDNLAKRVRIRLKNDKWVGGELGPTSRASTYPNPEQLFISRVYQFDDAGGVIDLGQETVGLLVNGTEISHIEITTIRKVPPATTGGSQTP
jgi:hypothetical protein